MKENYYLGRSKKYENLSEFWNHDFTDYAEEITGEELFKINGGAQVENSIEAQANAQVGDTLVDSHGVEHTLTQGDITWAQGQVGAGGNSSNSGNTSSGSQGSPIGQTGEEEKEKKEKTKNIHSEILNTEVPEEIKTNPQAYAYYMSLQGKALEEGNSDKYKGYNVLGNGKISVKEVKGETIQRQTAYDEEDYHCDIYSWNSALDNNLDPRGQNGEMPDLNNITVNSFYDYFPNNRNSTPPENTQGYVFYDWGSDGSFNHMEYYSAGAGTNYEVYQTDGINPQRIVTYNSQIDSNGSAGANSTAIFVPLQRR